LARDASRIGSRHQTTGMLVGAIRWSRFADRRWSTHLIDLVQPERGRQFRLFHNGRVKGCVFRNEATPVRHQFNGACACGAPQPARSTARLPCPHCRRCIAAMAPTPVRPVTEQCTGRDRHLSRFPEAFGSAGLAHARDLTEASVEGCVRHDPCMGCPDIRCIGCFG
jgi:hypothetical protein